MNQQFHEKKERALREFNSWRKSNSFQKCRLVHYAGLGEPTAIDVLMSEIEEQITGCLAEGLKVAWNRKGQTAFLVVQEPDCPIPEWNYVFQEKAVVDVEKILSEAGFGCEA